MEFYVYEHSRLSIGKIFYIGKGKDNRAHSSLGRNVYWKRIVDKDGGFIVNIIKDGLSEHDAFELEKRLISELALATRRVKPQVEKERQGENITSEILNFRMR